MQLKIKGYPIDLEQNVHICQTRLIAGASNIYDKWPSARITHMCAVKKQSVSYTQDLKYLNNINKNRISFQRCLNHIGHCKFWWRCAWTQTLANGQRLKDIIYEVTASGVSLFICRHIKISAYYTHIFRIWAQTVARHTKPASLVHWNSIALTPLRTSLSSSSLKKEIKPILSDL